MARKQDFLELLEDDHREAERVLAAYEATRDAERRRALAEELVAWTVQHLATVERHLHPAVRRAVPEGEPTVAAWPARRAAAEAAVRDLEAADPAGPDLDGAVRALARWIQEHAAEEERALLPPLRTALSHRERFALGAEAERARRGVVDPGSGVLDRVRAWLHSGA